MKSQICERLKKAAMIAAPALLLTVGWAGTTPANADRYCRGRECWDDDHPRHRHEHWRRDRVIVRERPVIVTPAPVYAPPPPVYYAPAPVYVPPPAPSVNLGVTIPLR